ncbi:rubrerythrin family protein [Natronorubrum sp. JWXQ-INN-674]|uniref:Rubrerythrin family protein n=1 Tax=Natronorubrum halalkaliphilum TaxID=2691917 RepID=A0A6B0VQ03_9EURY|nr:rubrerythrin family protein [Natronorubrum halalkaliphilum]MXV62862.1 rubrerythrin family protein [Natronorubrum halalkaliphilum]
MTDSESDSGSEAFARAVREDNQTALSRLGSSKSLYADTGGDIDTEPVLEATADAEYAAWQTFLEWADSEADDEVREAFEATAAEEKDHYETVINHLSADEYEPSEIPALHEYLRGLEATIERVGAFVGRILASKRSKEQVVGYFVGDADPQAAGVFREFGDDLDAQLERAEDLLENVCEDEDEDDRDRALEAANGAIEAAYGEYVENLEAMGANPKPVC